MEKGQMHINRLLDLYGIKIETNSIDFANHLVNLEIEKRQETLIKKHLIV